RSGGGPRRGVPRHGRAPPRRDGSPVRRARVRLLVATALVAAALSSASAQSKAVSEETVHEVATRLRCVVCQNLSVADSPSEMAGLMRAIIRDRLGAGARHPRA